ncbi:hybrid sensor histidine kinase/response regulator [Roseimaritima ulvae]|uniref:histidine kinase n=1 Tax=Roseimaritima ulvae TaxID=980254 RepID=A0A5B9QUF6_9BACT|nr:response regulator [Roseimaritima ulvae]QEG41045.1 Chemotaxis protein CheA [Roseimaritima ulvae]
MNSLYPETATFPATNSLSLEESRELLLEVRAATEGTSQIGVYEFAGLLCQVLDREGRAIRENNGEDAIAKFIATSLDEVRKVMNEDQSTSARMESLRDFAIDRWGELLCAIDDPDLTEGLTHPADTWSDEEDQAFGFDDDLVAPSAEEIGSLLGQLGQTPAVPAAPQAEPTPEPEPPPAAQPQRAAQSLPTQNIPLEVASAVSPVATPAAAPAQVETAPPHSSAVTIASLDPELRAAFLDDASSCVSSMESALLRLESNPQDSESLNQICRELHTLKGASGSVGLCELADHLHALEDRLRDDLQAGRKPDVESLLRSVDSIRAQVLERPASPATATPATNDSGTGSSVTEPSAVDSTVPPLSFDDGPADDETVRVQSSQLNRLMDMLAELVMLRNRRETELSELQEVYRELIGSVSKMRLISNDAHGTDSATGSLQLSEVANDVLEVAHHVRDCARPVAEGNTAVSQFIRQFRQELVELRRTPIGGLFRRLQRVVRDAAHAESKQVQLVLVGEDAGIERSIQQRLYEPLLHIIRNCVCHGIEAPEARTAGGKSPQGTITLEAKAGPDLFVIEVVDDGAGLNYEAIRRRAIESGLLTEQQQATRQQLSQLIFHPGFSTRQSADQMAGRGVGMDVVASTLKRMRGWLEVESEPQQGTRIRLSFPLPSVIQHVMVFRSAGQLFALPMQSVQSASEMRQQTTCVAFADLMGFQSQTAAEACQRIVLASDAPQTRGVGTATVPREQSCVTLLVDEIVGPEEVVVRPLPSLLKQHPFCVGATLSGFGQIVLLLDARRVVEFQQRNPAGTPVNAHELLAKQQAAHRDLALRPRVLVVDDSLSARKRVVRSLQRYPLDITEAADGKQAIAILKTNSFDAVFSDMEMPQVSGMELLAEINSGEREQPPPVVIISSRQEAEFTTRAKQLGANNYLSKPLADEDLDHAINNISSLQHLRPNLTVETQPRGEIR